GIEEEVYISNKIAISELLPNPSGDEAANEFIELVNLDDVEVDLDGYVLKDGSKSYQMKPQSVEPGEFTVLKREVTGLALNNSADLVELYSPTGELLSRVTYEKAPEDQSYANDQDTGNFSWTETVTPGEENIIFQQEPEEIVSEEPASKDEPSPNKTPSGPFSSQVVISEIMPNPEGPESSEEWIELHNQGDVDVNLGFWQLDDQPEGSKAYQIPADTIILAQSYLVFYNKESKISLNNSEDQARLLDPEGKLKSDMTYEETAKENISFIRTSDNALKWTNTPTPGLPNILSEANEQESQNQDSSGGDQTEELPKGPFSKEIVITEILPDPKGQEGTDEWVELYNQGTQDINLSYWQLDDKEGGSSPFIFPKDKVIKAKSYLVLKSEETRLSLSNNGDQVRLFFPDKGVTAKIDFAKSPQEGASYSVDEHGDWKWTAKPTPGSANSFATIEKKVTKKSSKASKAAKSSKKSCNYDTHSISSALGQEKGVCVKINATVSVAPGMLSKRYFYIQDQGAGMQVYKSQGDLPGVRIGDQVEIIGKISISKGEKRILLKEVSDVKVLAANQDLKVEVFKTGEVTSKHLGQLARIKATLIKIEGTVLYFDDGSGILKVVISQGSGLKAKDFIVGAEYELVGILRMKEVDIVLSPRSKEDVKMQTDNNSEALKGDMLQASDNLPFKDKVWWFVTGIVVLAAACYATFKYFRQKEKRTS
ncbi:lamin tail domain-containing protein, partial [Patescibacteria group bacterium]|nr:lamin tail domain-containing protein [Patescibacteria group bacterium]